MNHGPANPAEVLHEGRFLRLLRRAHWEFVQRVRSRGAGFILAVTPARELILVEQYRYPLDARCIELPAGIIADSAALADESVEASALRELEEETGFRARQAQIVFAAPTAPGMSSEPSYFVLADELERVAAGGGVDDEDIQVHLVPLDEVDAWLDARRAAGLQVDARVLAALYLLLRRGLLDGRSPE